MFTTDWFDDPVVRPFYPSISPFNIHRSCSYCGSMRPKFGLSVVFAYATFGPLRLSFHELVPRQILSGLISIHEGVKFKHSVKLEGFIIFLLRESGEVTITVKIRLYAQVCTDCWRNIINGEEYGEAEIIC
ncbi:hypothetical protein K1719_002081 [Acacia pycnantha]|nr:hypothetical protein K1719_002081 [Acacia pycnantha]